MEKKIAVNNKALHKISQSDLEFSFVTTGDIHVIRKREIFLNQLTGQEVDGSLSNIYLRIFEKEGEISVFPLIGKDSVSRFFIGRSQARWAGQTAGVDYEVTLKLSEDKWFWQVQLTGNGQEVDLVYVYDIGLADKAALQSNEAYNSQYIDHHVFENQGYVVTSRQNQEQSTGFPALESGALSKNWQVDGYLTDGFQFFGKSFKKTRQAQALLRTKFPNEVYQYEMALVGLKVQRIKLDAEAHEIVFYEKFTANQAEPISSCNDKPRLQVEFNNLLDEDFTEVKVTQSLVKYDKQLNGLDINEELLKSTVDNKFLEIKDGRYLSSFTEQNTHLVSQAKELLQERETGEVFLSGNSYSIKNRGLATTSYMYGLFNSQTVIGNTTMNKFLSNQRNHLNNFVLAGQRIFVKSDKMTDYAMLGLPSTFEMGYNFARWRYVLADDILLVTNFAANSEDSLQLEFQSDQGLNYDILILNQVLLDEIEYKSEANLTRLDAMTFDFTAGAGSTVQMGNPELAYRVKFDKAVEVLDTSSLFDGESFIGASLLVFKLSGSQFKLKITGALNGKFDENVNWLDFAAEAEHYKNFIEKDLLNSFRFIDTKRPELTKLNTILPWYAHDMMIHYLSPHGLEQYGGAAWGTRDVSQGPVEFFLSTGHAEVAREILLTLFSHQFEEDGTWPQWFMFDEYLPIFSGESHGDVIVWPFFAVSEYLEATGDFTILDEKLSFISHTTNDFTSEKSTLWQHLQKEIDYIKDNFLPGTHLSAYGNGDWDDTLQPANGELKARMTSSWTDALTYQAMKKFARVAVEVKPEAAAKLAKLADLIKQDFEKYLIKDGVIAGFSLQTEQGFEPVIHPQDTKTHMHYRLLPMDRSMIAELVDERQALQNLRLIDENLTFHDGVRLMEHSPEYKGGVSANFKRAEQAANFGREIGLLYVHAQIRYVEAMAKVGQADKAWTALEQTIPAGIQEIVDNAAPRQANVYFSSSDGDFKTRYEAQANFDKLKSGEVAVKGGWRLYSSGPGIFINQLISQLLGIRREKAGLVIDPVLPSELSDLTVNFKLDEKSVKFHFIHSDRLAVMIDGNEIENIERHNSYRKGGIFIDQTTLESVKFDSVITVKF